MPKRAVASRAKVTAVCDGTLYRILFVRDTQTPFVKDFPHPGTPLGGSISEAAHPTLKFCLDPLFLLMVNISQVLQGSMGLKTG